MLYILQLDLCVFNEGNEPKQLKSFTVSPTRSFLFKAIRCFYEE